MFLWLCEGGCGRALQLLTRTKRGLLCPPCWTDAGSPEPVGDGAHRQEERTRERMLARGGTDRHLVRTGKS